LDSLRDAIAMSVFALAEDPAELHPRYLVDMVEAMGAAELARALDQALIADDLEGVQWQLPNAYDNARTTLAQSSWAELCESRDIAMLCGGLNVTLQLQAVVDSEARALLRAVETDPRWFALNTLAFMPTAGRLSEIVWSTLLVAAHPSTRQGAEAYAEWLRPRVIELLGRYRLGPGSPGSVNDAAPSRSPPMATT